MILDSFNILIYLYSCCYFTIASKIAITGMIEIIEINSILRKATNIPY